MKFFSTKIWATLSFSILMLVLILIRYQYFPTHITPEIPIPNDEFGSSFSISDDTMVIGAWKDAEKANKAGAVYVFKIDNGVWNEYEKILPSKADSVMYFGASVNIEKDTLVISACSRNRSNPSGLLYIFKQIEGNWKEVQKFSTLNCSVGNNLIAINENLIAVGSPHGRSVNIFEMNNNHWGQVAILTPHDLDHNLEKGNYLTEIDMDENRIVVGMSNGGGAYVFSKSIDGWTEEHKFAGPQAFGFSVAIDKNKIIVGDPGSWVCDLKNCAWGGAAHVFVYKEGKWFEQAKLQSNPVVENAWLGKSVAIEGNIAVLGAPQEISGVFGAAYTFIDENENGQWVQYSKLAAGNNPRIDNALYTGWHYTKYPIINRQIINPKSIWKGAQGSYRYPSMPTEGPPISITDNAVSIGARTRSGIGKLFIFKLEVEDKQ